jgi:hypothetical protein
MIGFRVTALVIYLPVCNWRLIAPLVLIGYFVGRYDDYLRRPPDLADMTKAPARPWRAA